MNAKFEEALRKNLTLRAVGTSALRSQGRKGVIDAVHRFLGSIHPREIRAPRSRRGFEDWLNEQTKNLKNRVGRSHGLKWGSARKALNLWLRDLVYNHHFRASYRLEKLEPWLEVPLDSYTAKFIRRESRETLPRWTTVIAVTPDFSAAFQEAARRLVANGEFAYLRHRVHIDLAAWREGASL